MIWLIADHQGGLPGQLAGAETPEQVEQAVVLERGHDRDPLRALGLRESMLDSQRLRDLAGKPCIELLALGRRRRLEHQTHQQPPLSGRMLIEVDDVAVGRGEEAGDPGDDSGAIGAAEQQASRFHGPLVSRLTP